MALFSRLSFQTKLLLSFGMIVILALVISYSFIQQSVQRAFQAFIGRSINERDILFSNLLAEHYQQVGSWNGVDQFFRQRERNDRAASFVLAEPTGAVIYTPNRRLNGQKLSEKELGSGIPIKVNEQVVGILVPIAPLPPPGAPAPDRVFLSAVNGALWTAGILVAGLGFIIALILIRQITLPLRALDAATRQITQGKLQERVPVRNSDELGRLASSFNEMAANLEKAEQTKRNMIADIAHELRTPLSVIRSELEGYMDGVLEPTPENIAALHNQVLLVSRLVSDLQQLALADAGQLSIQRELCDLRSLMEDIQATVDAQLEEQNVQLVMDVPKDLPQVLADRQRIEQVLLNLLSNATRYTPAGGTITIKAQTCDERFVRLSVCDTGPGLSEEDLAHAFDRFYRADKSRARVSGGSGLGLAISKAIIEAHGGRIWAENVSPTGACFHFTLERTVSHLTEPSLQRIEPHYSAQKSL
ncbi:HAMP domain-containing protein [Candidatus Acetothermia bacterium]|nr:HAMP domain-containing protein [Candidatus Acetothermia bacterium]